MSIETFTRFKAGVFLINHELVSPRFVVRSTRLEKKTAEVLEQAEAEEAEVKKLRQENYRRVGQLNLLLRRSEGRDLESEKERLDLETSSIKEIRKYGNNLARQIEDISRIIEHLHKLIVREDLEVIYDTKAPLGIVEHFAERLRSVNREWFKRKAWFRKKLSPEAQKKIREIFEVINKELKKLVDEVFSFIKRSLDFYDKKVTDKSLAEHLKERTLFKRKINGKVQWIKSQITQLEKRLKRELKESEDKETVFLKELTYFKDQFEELIKFSILRVQIAEFLIIESLRMQKEKYNELNKLREEASRFYEGVIKQQEGLLAKETSLKKKGWFKKRQEEFAGNKAKVEAIVAGLSEKVREMEKAAVVKLEVKKNKVIKELDQALEREQKAEKAEKEEERRVNAWVDRWKLKTAKVMIGITALATLSGAVTLGAGAVKFGVQEAAGKPSIMRKMRKPILEGAGFKLQKVSATEFVFSFDREGVVVDLSKYPEIIKFDKKLVTTTTWAKEKITIREEFKIESLAPGAETRISVENKEINIYGKDVLIVDGPTRLACSAKKEKIKIKAYGFDKDYAGKGLRKFVHNLDGKDNQTDVVVLVDNNFLPDVPTRTSLFKKGLNPKKVYEDALRPLVGASIYWGAPGVMDSDHFNLVCNGVMRSMLYSILGNRFIKDANNYTRRGMVDLRSNVFWNRYFSRKGAFIKVGAKKKVTLLKLNEYLQKKNVRVRPGMAIQLFNPKTNSRHSVVISQVNEKGEVTHIIGGHVPLHVKFIGKLDPSRDTGVGEVEELKLLEDLHAHPDPFTGSNYFVEGFVDVYAFAKKFGLRVDGTSLLSGFVAKARLN